MPRIPRPTDHTSLPRPYHWSDDAACAGADLTLFFPVGRGGVPASVGAADAKRYCGMCHVRLECLTHALESREEYGVWGGMDEDERAALRKKRRKARVDASPAA